ncbi:MurT ligase domain-containing protein [Dysosmobacter sp.]|uniref:MurT ligase domain-containing protein n=1 Tax=Dysosmobacter sp. TaxID=2591382 RepID=UPI003AB58155
MRAFFAILVCKLGRLAGKLVGKGSSLPGKFALKICPDILRRVQLPAAVIAVTGSNGKTSTVEMIAAVLRDAGKTVVYNAEGSNQIEGVTTTVLTHATLGGKVRSDVLLIESDERYAAHSFRYFHPTHFVVTNLYRDQLTRNGHPEWVYDALLPAIHPETELVLNADDPLSSCFARGHEKVRWFGLDRCPSDQDTPGGVYRDGACCPVCGGPMTYDFVHYNHIGAYRCAKCGHHRPERTDFTATALDLTGGTLTLDGQYTVSLAFRSIYNVYNILAAYAACRLAGVDGETIVHTVSNYILKNGRMQTFTLGGRRGTLLTSKHENSIAYDTNLRYIRQEAKAPCTVLVIVDAVSRKYFTSETSWLWDIDFDLLNCPQVEKVILSGRYCNDLAERFSFTGLPREAWQVCPGIPEAAEQLASQGSGELYVVTCFSDRDKLLDLPAVKKEAL